MEEELEGRGEAVAAVAAVPITSVNAVGAADVTAAGRREPSEGTLNGEVEVGIALLVLLIALRAESC